MLFTVEETLSDVGRDGVHVADGLADHADEEGLLDKARVGLGEGGEPVAHRLLEKGRELVTGQAQSQAGHHVAGVLLELLVALGLALAGELVLVEELLTVHLVLEDVVHERAHGLARLAVQLHVGAHVRRTVEHEQAQGVEHAQHELAIGLLADRL